MGQNLELLAGRIRGNDLLRDQVEYDAGSLQEAWLKEGQGNFHSGFTHSLIYAVHEHLQTEIDDEIRDANTERLVVLGTIYMKLDQTSHRIIGDTLDHLNVPYVRQLGLRITPEQLPPLQTSAKTFLDVLTHKKE